MRNTLHLNLRREFFDAIAAGTKRIEYRELKPYWKKRLEGRHYDVIKFRNGYATNAPEMLVKFRGIRKRNRNYEILLGRVLKIRRWKQ
jgi:ASC-1-like (ASCH) protein